MKTKRTQASAQTAASSGQARHVVDRHIDILKDRNEINFFGAANTFVRGRVDAKPSDLPCRIYIQAQKNQYFLLINIEKYPTLSEFFKRSDSEHLTVPREAASSMVKDLSIHFKIYLTDSIRVRMMVKLSNSKKPVILPDANQDASKAGFKLRQAKSLDKLLNYEEFYSIKLNIRPSVLKPLRTHSKVDHVKSNILTPVHFDKNFILEKAKMSMNKYYSMKERAVEKKQAIQVAKQREKFLLMHKREFNEMLRVDQMEIDNQRTATRIYSAYLMEAIWTYKTLEAIRERFMVVCLDENLKRSRFELKMRFKPLRKIIVAQKVKKDQQRIFEEKLLNINE